LIFIALVAGATASAPLKARLARKGATDVSLAEVQTTVRRASVEAPAEENADRTLDLLESRLSALEEGAQAHAKKAGVQLAEPSGDDKLDELEQKLAGIQQAKLGAADAAQDDQLSSVKDRIAALEKTLEQLKTSAEEQGRLASLLNKPAPSPALPADFDQQVQSILDMAKTAADAIYARNCGPTIAAQVVDSIPPQPATPAPQGSMEPEYRDHVNVYANPAPAAPTAAPVTPSVTVAAAAPRGQVMFDDKGNMQTVGDSTPYNTGLKVEAEDGAADAAVQQQEFAAQQGAYVPHAQVAARLPIEPEYRF